MTAYIPFGPWTDGSAPGIDASYLNAQETFLSSINPIAVNTALTPVIHPGTTAGNIYVWQFAGGPTIGLAANCYKLILMYFQAYENSSGVRQRIPFPSPLSNGGIVQVGSIHVPTASRGIYAVDSTGTGRNINVFTGFNTVSNTTLLPCYAVGEFTTQTSYIDVDGSTTGPANGWIRIEGV